MDAKYLGVSLSNDLEWSKHIATMTNKANSKLSFLRRNLKGCPEKLNTQMSHILNIVPIGTIKMHFFIIIITPIERSLRGHKFLYY